MLIDELKDVVFTDEESIWWTYNTPPIQEQINIVNKITQVLGIKFPTCSNQYNKSTYSWFIKNYAQEFKLKEHNWLETNEYKDDITRMENFYD